MNDVYLQIVSYLSGIWRRRWYALSVAWLVCGAGWTAVAYLPDRYESSARIYVDADSMLGPLMRGMTVEPNLHQQIDIMRRTLLSRPNLEKIVMMTDLDLQAKTPKQRAGLIASLGRRIDVIQQGRNLFEITYSDSDAALAKRVVQAVMQVFVEGNLGASRTDMETTQRFIDGQLRDYDRQLVEAEAKIAKFKRDNIAFLPGSGNYYQHMQEMNAQLAQGRAKVEEATMVRDELRAQLGAVPQYIETAAGSDMGATGSSGPESDTQLRILDLQNTLEQLLTRYTDQYPDVVAVKRQIAALQKKLENGGTGADDAAADQGKDAAPSRNLVPNPVYEQIKLQLVQQEGVIAALKSRVEQAQKEVAKWAGMAKLVPQVEAQLTQLNRDYEIIKKGYEQLRQRQEAAKIAREMETKAQKVQFRIVDPPKMPLKPNGPNRPLLTSFVLLAGIVVGLAFAFLLSQINSTFVSVQRLRSTFTLPVLGRVSAILSPVERHQRVRELAGFAVITFALIAAFAGLLGVEVLRNGSAVGTMKQIGVL